MDELSKLYEPGAVQTAAQKIWDQGGYFHADPAARCIKGSYTIVIPPPNVTAALHLGHALNNTLQDILIRYHRMRGFNTLWMPGTDHAGIATQTVVEKRLLKEKGKRRTEFSRTEFVGHVQAWKDEYEARILAQLKAMGCSCDWQRTRFTMDETCAKAVRANFFNLFRDGLIFRGKRLVNWDPATQTVLADDEVEHELIKGHFWYLKYPLAEPVKAGGQTIEHITVATTRPETMLGDTAVAMHPADPRASVLVGRMVRLPIVGRLIPIIADDHVVLPNPESEDEKARFSTGFLKVTPAHDPNDWEIGRRHSLAAINVMAPDGSISNKHGWDDATTPEAQGLLGLDRFEAREVIVEWFRKEKLLEEVREYSHEVGHSYRSHVPIEPYLSDQWYIAVKKPIEHLAAQFGSGLIAGTDVPVNSLAGLALKPLLDNRLRIIPERYAKTYQTWLENLRDWPISRQLWWGHQIPVWSFTLTKQQHFSQAVSELESLLKSRGIVGKISTYRKDENPNTVYVCLDNIKDDNIFDKIAIESGNINTGQAYNPGDKLKSDQLGPISKEVLEFLERYVEGDICRDDDVLDTWFSSALWPFSTLGWPEATPEMKTYYPGNLLCTAREIITLWVSRMVMMGQYCASDIPFGDVYIHAMIQDGLGRKMSKSLGNGIDPLDIIDSHGADAMRFTLASMTTDTQDVRMPVEELKLPDGRTANTSPKFDIGRNFCNKLWNASRFAMMNLEGTSPAAFDAAKMDISDRWILSRLAATAAEASRQIDAFKFNEPVMQIYRFFWNDLCDWYLEWVKPRMRDDAAKPIAQNVLAFVLDQTLRLLHPFVPFITEGIFQQLRQIAPDRRLPGIAEPKSADAVIVAAWPEGLDSLIRPDIDAQIELVQNVIRPIREIRNQYNVPPKNRLTATAAAGADRCEILNKLSGLIVHMAGLERFETAPAMDKPGHAAAAMVGDIRVFVHHIIDPAAERQRLAKQREQIEAMLKPVEAKLANPNFVGRAKPEVIEQARARLAELQGQLASVKQHFSELESA